MTADVGNLGGNDDERSVGRQPEELGGFPGVGRREMAFEEGLEERGALLLGGVGLGGRFFSVAVGQLLAVGVEDLPHLRTGLQHDLAIGAHTAGGVGHLFPHEPGGDPVGLQDGGQRDTRRCSAPSVLS